MKTTFIALVMIFLSAGLFAQRDMKRFEHLSVSVEAGSTGLGAELAMPLGNRVASGLIDLNLYPVVSFRLIGRIF